MASGTIWLVGDNWASQSVGFFAVEILLCFVLVLCLFFSPAFKWVFVGGKDTFRTFAFVLSTILALIYFIFDLASTGLEERNAVVSSYYFVLFIFAQLVYQIAELIILIVIARTVNLLAFRDFANQAAHRGARFLTFFFIGLVGIVSLVTLSLYASFYGYLANGYNADNIGQVTIGFLVGYGAVYVVASIFIFVIITRAVVRQRSRASLLMLFVVTCLLIRALLILIAVTVEYFSTTGNYEAVDDLQWASYFIYNIMTMGIYLGVTTFAFIGFNHDPIPKHEQDIELAPFAKPHVYL